MRKKHSTTNNPKVLLLDVETSPIHAHVWSLWNNDVGLNQIVKDWHLLSYSAKWLGEDKLFYLDQRKQREVSNDKALLLSLRALLEQADIVIGHNVSKFDIKKINARMLLNQIEPLPLIKEIDTLKLCKKRFALTSNRLEYVAQAVLGKGFKKDSHKNFPGHNLWTECLKGNIKAWKEMEQYNKQDVVVLEALFNKLKDWGLPIQIEKELTQLGKCICGSSNLKKDGIRKSLRYTFQRLKCNDCGKITQRRLTAKEEEEIAS